MALMLYKHIESVKASCMHGRMHAFTHKRIVYRQIYVYLPECTICVYAMLSVIAVLRCMQGLY